MGGVAWLAQAVLHDMTRTSSQEGVPNFISSCGSITWLRMFFLFFFFFYFSSFGRRQTGCFGKAGEDRGEKKIEGDAQVPLARNGKQISHDDIPL